MTLEILPKEFTICKTERLDDFDGFGDIYFIGRTNREISIVCQTESVPSGAVLREDGWRGFRIAGTLDFSLTGILAKISKILADEKIGIFALST